MSYVNHIHNFFSGVPVPGGRPASEWNTEMDAIAGVLRLSAKYEFTALHTRLCQVIQVYWPTTLVKWDERIKLTSSSQISPSHPPDPRKVFCCSRFFYLFITRTVTAITLAHEADVPDITHSAMYELSRYMWQIVDATTRHPYRPASRKLSTLPQVYILQLLDGREWLRVAVIKLMKSALPYKMSTVCCQPSSPNGRPCSSRISTWWDDQYNQYEQNDFLFHDPIRVLLYLRQELDKDLKLGPSRSVLCLDCNEKVQKLIDRARQYLWDEIPYRFCHKPRDGTVKPFDFSPYL